MKKHMNFLIAVILITALVIPLTYGAANIMQATGSTANAATATGGAGGEADSKIPVVGTKDKLKSIIKERVPDYDRPQNFFIEMVRQAGFGVGGSAPTAVFDAGAPQMNGSENTMRRDDSVAVETEKSYAAEAGAANAGGGADHSTTNVQVAGVDEGDIVKTDGEYIYQVNTDKIVIIKAYPASEMKIVSEIEFNRSDMLNPALYPVEVYVDGERLVVIGNAWEGRQSKSYTKAMVYDIADRANVKQVREVALEGNYLSSRKLGDSLYLISNEYMNYYPLLRGSALEFEDAIPTYKDSAAGEKFVKVDLADMRYFPNDNDLSHTFIAGFRIDGAETPADITSFLGGGRTVYCGKENLYIAKPIYNYGRINANYVAETTEVYRFAIGDGKVSFEVKGAVKGHPLNQFSMDEYAGHFRIAVTENQYDESTMRNNLYVLSADTLEMTGKIEGMAKGERIYSVRFMGEKGYIVTFRTIDPLFTLDLSDPKNPKVLGELKIPGFSQYLHPYDENHIIGFGRDTEVIRENWNGYISERVVETGMKMALFDVTDPAAPKEKFSTKVGGRGTFSEILHNHRALLFSKEKDVIAFPVTVYKQEGAEFDYGRATFQGAIVYGLDLEKGFTLTGMISHTGKQTGDYWSYDYSKEVERILYIRDVFYTTSKSLVKASEMATLKEIKSVEVKTSETHWIQYVE